MNGMFSLKATSRIFQTDRALTWWEALLLLGSGALAVVLHRSLDYALGLPGHHGIEWMALLIIGRGFSRFRGAGSIASIGASFATFVPGLRGGDPFIWIFYLLPGPVMDAAFYYLPRYANKIWFLVLLGGLAHVTKPLARLVLAVILGWAFGSFRNGVFYPVMSHFLFGMIGGLLGALIVLGVRKIQNQASPI